MMTMGQYSFSVAWREGLDNNTEFQRRTEVAVFFVVTAFYAIINIPFRHFANRSKVKGSLSLKRLLKMARQNTD